MITKQSANRNAYQLFRLILSSRLFLAIAHKHGCYTGHQVLYKEINGAIGSLFFILLGGMASFVLFLLSLLFYFETSCHYASLPGLQLAVQKSLVVDLQRSHCFLCQLFNVCKGTKSNGKESGQQRGAGLLVLCCWQPTYSVSMEKNNLAYLNLLLFNLQRSKGPYLAAVVGWLSLLVNFSVLVYFGS